MMRLPLGFGSVDWSDWLRGLVASFVVGGSSAVVSGFVVSTGDPEKFGLGTGKFYELVFTVFLASGMLNMFSFLRTKPIPDLKTVVTTVTTVGKAADPNPIVTTKVQETQIVPVPAVPAVPIPTVPTVPTIPAGASTSTGSKL